MAYNIIKSDGTLLTTIADGTINTTSSSVGLPGRNFAGYGQTLDTNFVWLTENFAANSPPANPLAGQLWFNTNANTLYVCPEDGLANANAWLALAQSGGSGTTTFGNVTANNITANNVTTSNTVSGLTGSFTNISVSSTANISSGTANIGTANITTLNTRVITTGSTTTTGALTGTWSVNGDANSLIISSGNISISNVGNLYGIRTDRYMYANGDPIPLGGGGSYNNSNVQAFLPTYQGIVGNTDGTAQFRGTTITTGANTTAGTITGNWSLSTGSRLSATYADLAERFEADAYYDAGTVVEMGGDKEITAVQYDLSEDVFGVVSDTAAYLMNSAAGDDTTHPPIAVGGRVKVKIIGKVKKGDRLVSAGNGVARSAKTGEATSFNVIGRSLENKTTDDTGTVEAFVKIN
jgi:hypothetical protein